MPIQIVHVDAFTDRPFHGNPAAVCLLSTARPDAWMQQVAREMNLSETAFLTPETSGFQLRWFTPLVEIDLCGHATLASAHVLWESGVLPAGGQARFVTRSGQLTAEQRGRWIELDFPMDRPQEMTVPSGIEAALGTSVCQAAMARSNLLIEVASEDIVRAITPDMALLRQLPFRGVIVTSRSDAVTADFVSRYFAPQLGVPEDPVTGSAHCVLAPFWSERLSKPELIGYQASARGGTVRVRLNGERVMLGGQAVTVLRGELLDTAKEVS